MKNVTITVEDSVLEWARIEAAKRNSSVSRLLGELLADKMRQEDAYEQAMREALKFESWGTSQAPSLTRDQKYERARFR
ncbi:MAG TPA: CopG family transcriptional regulator, partial [Ramlibacter sp.]|nr:CopG family transcriptional regulator [Ramlibacter sp.]